MLLNLHVKNMAIIDEIEVDFNDGLNIMTGETGTGKSIIIGSINIALGKRVPKDIVRTGAEYGLVELLFSIENDMIVKELEELGIELSDNELLISRKIVGNRSITKINGENITGTTLKKVADLLIDIHSQHENQKLLEKKYHIENLDRFAKNDIAELRENVKKLYNEFNHNKQELKEIKTDDEKRLREISFLEFVVNEIESVNFKDGEDALLEERYKVLNNMSNICEGLNEIYGHTSDNNGAGNDISHAVRIINKISEYDERIEEFKNQLIDIESILSEFNKNISDYMLEADDCSSELSEVEERLNIINNLKAKYGNSYEEVRKYYEESLEKLDKYRNYDVLIKELEKKISDNEKELKKESEKLSELRKKAAKVLEKELTEALMDLNFPDVRFSIKMEEAEYSQNGMDDVEFIIATNPGEELRPLSKIVSGGELSRIMLGFKSVLAKFEAIDTLIFDEIDTGISGRTAQKVSERLEIISKSRQVICITHLPQIAAMADSHYVIEKIVEADRTSSNIRRLDDEESVSEVARIIGGAKITEAVMTNAKEMIELAKSIKSK